MTLAIALIGIGLLNIVVGVAWVAKVGETNAPGVRTAIGVVATAHAAWESGVLMVAASVDMIL